MFRIHQKLVQFFVRDARNYQILCLLCLLGVGVTRLEFDIRPLSALFTILSALATQYAFQRAFGLPKFDPRSPAISSLSLILLLRTSSLWIAILSAFVAIASKYIVRYRGKHIFNPTNIGIVLCLLLFDNVWISPGQWGSGVLVLFVFSIAGVLVLSRAARSDVSFVSAGREDQGHPGRCDLVARVANLVRERIGEALDCGATMGGRATGGGCRERGGEERCQREGRAAVHGVSPRSSRRNSVGSTTSVSGASSRGSVPAMKGSKTPG